MEHTNCEAGCQEEESQSHHREVSRFEPVQFVDVPVGESDGACCDTVIPLHRASAHEAEMSTDDTFPCHDRSTLSRGARQQGKAIKRAGGKDEHAVQGKDRDSHIHGLHSNAPLKSITSPYHCHHDVKQHAADVMHLTASKHASPAVSGSVSSRSAGVTKSVGESGSRGGKGSGIGSGSTMMPCRNCSRTGRCKFGESCHWASTHVPR